MHVPQIYSALQIFRPASNLGLCVS